MESGITLGFYHVKQSLIKSCKNLVEILCRVLSVSRSFTMSGFSLHIISHSRLLSTCWKHICTQITQPFYVSICPNNIKSYLKVCWSGRSVRRIIDTIFLSSASVQFSVHYLYYSLSIVFPQLAFEAPVCIFLCHNSWVS